MSHVLYRMGRFSARRPLVVIGAWLVLSVLVVGASSTWGRSLDDSVAVPGLDSQQAVELLSRAHSDRAGLTAYVVATPRDEHATFFDSADARADLAGIQGRIVALPHVLGATDPAAASAGPREAAVAGGAVSADGRVALVRVQYPVRDELGLDDLTRLKAAAATPSDGRLQVEMGGDLFFAFEQPATGIGEMVGLVAAIIILLLAFGSVIAMGLPIVTALLGLAASIGLITVFSAIVDVNSVAPCSPR